jgi:colanic acid/amylovoran biosynthesis glycosyltransferase
VIEDLVNIAYLVSQYPAINHTFILREIRRLRQAGFTIRVISVRPPDRPASQMIVEEQDELTYTRAILGLSLWKTAASLAGTLLLRPIGFLRGLGLVVRLGGGAPRRTIEYLFYLAEAVIAGRWMMKEGYSHFHVHFSSTVGLLVTAVFPLTMSITFHGPDEFTDPEGFHLARKVNACAFVCAISHFARSQLMRFSHPSQWSKIEVSRLGVDTALYSPRPQRNEPDVFELICVGRLAPVKAQHVLIEAVSRLTRGHYRVRLRLVGDGPDRSSLEARVAELGIEASVVFEGWCNQDAVRALYTQADLFVLASFAEGVPVVLMEAMAMEIPCVATWVAGIPELITDGIHGLLLAPSDEEGLSRAIARLLDDPELRSRLGHAGRSRVLEQYNLDTNLTRLAEIFRSRLARQADKRVRDIGVEVRPPDAPPSSPHTGC